MTIPTTVSSIEVTNVAEKTEFSRQIETYDISRIDSSHPEFAAVGYMTAQIQGEDYIRSGYIEPSKLTEDGRMPDSVDQDKCSVVHYVAHPKGKGLSETQAALKKISLNEGESLDGLPAYKYCKNLLYIGWDSYLNENKQRIVEIGGLCRLDEVDSKMVSHELMRDTMQHIVRQQSDEVWLMTFADKAYKSMVASFGESVIRQIGEPLTIDEPDEHVMLRPCLIQPYSVVDDLYKTIKNDTPAELEGRRAMTLLFMADGLDDGELSDDVKMYLNEVRTALS